MTWRDQLQPASFRGVEFKVASHDMSFGRRAQLHEFPLRDKPYVEDLGRKARTYNIEAYVIGPDYMAQRDKLIEALEKQGPGTLVHRYYGQLRVQVLGEPRVRESNREGGWAQFSMVFVEAGEEPRPLATIDTRQKVAASSDNALGIVQQNFESEYVTEGLPGWVTDSSRTVLGKLDETLANVSLVADVISDYVTLPSQISSRLVSAMSLLSGMTQYRSLSGFGTDLLPVPTTTPSRIQQAKNQAAVVNLVRRVSLVEATRFSSQQNYDSQQAAISIRDELANDLDTEMLTADDETYIALQDLRSDMVRDLTDRAAKLKQVRNYTPNATLPALVIAHTIYQDALRDQDIVARNNISHPGFIRGGNALEVLNA